ncbi:MAG TPA: hypothetical protein VFL98_02000 [Candidatus Paceibacterota bacterium]|nr:hypothetical protein [Candidatus Paceibacterota bacterium]
MRFIVPYVQSYKGVPMNSHDRRIRNRLWQSQHADEISRVRRMLAAPRRYSFASLSERSGVITIEMKEIGFAAFGSQDARSSQYWRTFLRERGITA